MAKYVARSLGTVIEAGIVGNTNVSGTISSRITRESPRVSGLDFLLDEQAVTVATDTKRITSAYFIQRVFAKI